MRSGRPLVIGALLVSAAALVSATGISSSVTLAGPAARQAPDGAPGSGTTARPTSA